MRYFLFLLIPIVTFSLYSCTKCTCDSRTIDGIALMNYDSTADTIATVNTYEKNTNFSTLVNSYGNQKIRSWGVMPFSFGDVYDYIITILPAGKQYKLKDISYGSNSSSSVLIGLGPCDQCYTSVSYTIDDSVHIDSHGAGSSDNIVIPVY